LPEFRNPNQGGGGSQDNRSFLIMMLVMLGVIGGLQLWRAQHNPALESPDHPAAVSTSSAAPSTSSAATASSTTTPTAANAASTTPAVVAAAQTSTVVENEVFRITFSNKGGQVTSWILKKYKDSTGHELDMVHNGAANLYGYPLSLYTYDAGLNQQLSTALYVPSATGKLTAPATLTFKYSQGNLSVIKTFTFTDTYVIHADTQVLRDGAPVRALLSWPAGLGDMETTPSYGQQQLDISTDGKDTHDAPKKVTGGATITEPLDFGGFTDQYFAAIFIPDQTQDATMVGLEHQVVIQNLASGATISTRNLTAANGTPQKGFIAVPLLGAAVGDLTGHNQVRIFIGPKAMPVLKGVTSPDGRNLAPVLDFGFWGPISKGLYYSLYFVQAHIVSNWGWAIIIFTVFINLVVLPLRVQGMKSALKMQRIQPQIDAIKAKYKNPKATDPKAGEMNAEIMAMQKENGVSMLGGCIPSLIQMPLLIAFFYMMTKVVELRHAHWYYLHDLAAPDPYHILPILMFATSFLAQYYTPSPGVDPQQQKMMAFMMPVFSAYMTWNYAAALGLYWNVGNFIMIIQQQVMNRTSMGREMKEIAAKRARRKSAAPKPGQRVAPVKTIQGRK
jgi:YidC/Oxa1 family membrane protein insertase